MSVDFATVVRVARLARIGLREDEIAPLADSLNGILRWVEQLNEVDTNGVEPMASLGDPRLRLREDKVDDGGKPGDVVANAPEAADGFFAVPKVVE